MGLLWFILRIMKVTKTLELHKINFRANPIAGMDFLWYMNLFKLLLPEPQARSQGGVWRSM